MTTVPTLEPDRPDPTASTDGGLLRAVAAGDEGALSALWCAHSAIVRRLATDAARVAAIDPDEVVQMTMTKVWRAAATFDPDQSTEQAFIAAIARRVVVDRARMTIDHERLVGEIAARLTRLSDAGQTALRAHRQRVAEATRVSCP